MVYKLVSGFNKEGADFLLDKKVGRPCVGLSGDFVEKVEKKQTMEVRSCILSSRKKGLMCLRGKSRKSLI